MPVSDETVDAVAAKLSVSKGATTESLGEHFPNHTLRAIRYAVRKLVQDGRARRIPEGRQIFLVQK